MPRVSVITPTFNHAAFIQECVRSVKAQTFEDWEMIVVDDGSTDGTADLVNGLGDPRVKVLQQENRGLADLKGTYNAGLRESSGELVAILEGDDTWPSDKLEVQVPDFDDAAVVLSSGLTEMVDDEGKQISVEPGDPIPERAQLNRPVGIAALDLLNTRHLTFTFPVSTVVRRSALDKIGGFQQPESLPLVDLPTFLRLSVEGEFRFHDRILGMWRRHTGSATRSRLPAILDGVHRLAFDFLREHGREVPADEAEVDALDDQWASFQAHRRVLVGRWLLSEGRKKEARALFDQALRYRGGLKRRMKAWIGILGCFGIPNEPLFRAFGLASWQDEVKLHSGDSTVDLEMAEREVEPYDLLSAWKSR